MDRVVEEEEEEEGKAPLGFLLYGCRIKPLLYCSEYPMSAFKVDQKKVSGMSVLTHRIMQAHP